MQGESKLGGTNVTLLMVADPGDFAGTGKPFSLVNDFNWHMSTGCCILDANAPAVSILHHCS